MKRETVKEVMKMKDDGKLTKMECMLKLGKMALTSPDTIEFVKELDEYKYNKRRYK